MPPLVAYNTRALIGQPGDDDIIQPADCICSMVGGEGQRVLALSLEELYILRVGRLKLGAT